MRLIDGDALLQEIEESANAVEIQIHLGKCNKDVAKGMLSGLALVRENVLRKPTAYDPEKVAAELDESSFLMEPRTEGHYADNGVFLDEAIKIVRKGGAE